MYDCSRHGHTSPMVASFLPSPPKEETKQRRKGASADGMKLARCARSDSHSVRALRAVKSPPYGVGLRSNGRGAAPVLSLRRAFAMRIPFDFVSLHGDADLHHDANDGGTVDGDFHRDTCQTRQAKRSPATRSLLWTSFGSMAHHGANDGGAVDGDFHYDMCQTRWAERSSTARSLLWALFARGAAAGMGAEFFT